MRRALLTINPFSRPGYKLKSVRGIVIHWVENPRTTAMQNRNFFELRKEGVHGYGSSHVVIDEKNIVECIPEDEMAYHVGAKKYTAIGYSISSYPNARTLGVELCHKHWDGKPGKNTYKQLVEYLTQRCIKYHLDPMKHIYTHHDITGKICPKYYVENPEEFQKLKVDVLLKMEKVA